jgi:site-specific recombinase XerD
MRFQRRSDQTRAAYAEASKQFHAYLLDHKLPTDPAELKREHVRNFIAHLAERGASPATCRSRFSALRAFFGFLVREEEIEASPMTGMTAPKVDEQAPEVLTEDELRALLKACEGSEFEDYRDRALIRLMLDAGLRRGEAAGLLVEDLDLPNGTVLVLPKGRQQKEPRFFGVNTARELDRYQRRARARHRLAGLPNLWLAQKGPLQGDGVHHAIQRRARLAGIERRVWPHLLRHTFGHMLKSAGASDEVTMTAGGWRDSKSMRRYGASARVSRAQAAYRELSPGDRL